MKKYSLALAWCALFAAGSITGCKKALDVAPTESIEASTALTTLEGMNAALVGIYSRHKSARLYGRDLIALPEALADNAFGTNRSGRLFPESNNQLNSHFSTLTWGAAYTIINEANLILAAAPGATFLTPAQRSSIEGQAFFLRALNHLNLALIYAYMPGAEVSGQSRGGIPLMLTGTNTITGALATKPARSSIDSVYAQIVADFTEANSRLTPTGIAPFTFPNFATKRAAQAMLSRVNLYRKNFSEAKRWADSSIAGAGSLLTSGAAYVTGWRAQTHPETLFQIAYVLAAESNGVNEALHTTFTTLGAPGATGTTVGWGDLIPSLFLLNDLGITLGGAGNTTANFRDNIHTIASRSADVRNQLYEVGTSGRGPAKVEVTKYLGKNAAPNLDNVPVIRIAEVYLNRAEAMATPGSPALNEAAALADLNRILNARSLPSVTLTGTALYEEILRQRRIELAMEGHRLWDLKRLGRDIIKSPVYNGGDLPFTDFRLLARLPQQEIDVNPNIQQNAGY
jgi:hypothetical protein